METKTRKKAWILTEEVDRDSAEKVWAALREETAGAKTHWALASRQGYVQCTYARQWETAQQGTALLRLAYCLDTYQRHYDIYLFKYSRAPISIYIPTP